MTAAQILIVDDDDVDRERLQRILVEIDGAHRIVLAASGEEARERLKSQAFDCVFVDLRLGDIDGFELLPEINAHSDQPCAAIIVTGAGDESCAVEAVRSGAVDYISKSTLRPHVVRNAIAKGMHTAQLERELRETQERLSRLAMFDGLTGLPNRSLFCDRLDHAILSSRRAPQRLAVMMLDLDLFKDVNDNYGHAAGDEVLVRLGQRIRSIMRESDTIARFGGDEFGILLPRVDSPDAARVVAEKIIAAATEPIPIGLDLVSVGISIGIAMFPTDGESAETLLSNADAAMYRAKRGTRGYEFHVGSGANAKERRIIASHILTGIDRNELLLEYQPKLRLADGVAAGVEALVRWQSPEFGRLLPGQFLPTAERTSAIKPLTYAVFDLALRQLSDWQSQGVNTPVSVNLSSRMLDDPKLSSHILSELRRYAIAPQSLTVELTETALMINPPQARSFLHALSKAGIRISVDDFGVGYASLRQLRDLHVGEIKIDQDFITALARGGRDYSIVRSILSLGEGFGVPVVAEGVETDQVLSLLRELGCDYAQGYLIARPMAAACIPQWFASHPSLVDASRA